MRRCSRCGMLKPISQFSFRSLAAGTRDHRCKPCYNAYRNKRDKVRPDNSHNRGSKRLRGKQCKLHPECATIDRNEVLRRGNGICGICGKRVRRHWHMDHIQPISRGGKHCYLNLQPTHISCNLRKGNSVAQ